MANSTQIELEKILTSEMVERLEREAMRSRLTIDDVVRDAIIHYLDEDDDGLEDTPNEKILDDFRQGWHEAMTGKTVSANFALQRLREKLSHE
jgi:hypothetical protein